MAQKVIKIGKSTGITIPKEILEKMRLKAGDQVRVEYDKKKRSLYIKPSVEIDEELLDWADKFIEKYRPALEALAEK